MADFVEKIMDCISEFLWLKINRVFQVVIEKFQLTCSTSYSKRFCLRKFLWLFRLVFYLSKTPQSFSLSVFRAISRVLSAYFQKGNWAKCVQDWDFKSWHTRNTLYLTLACLRSTLVRCPFYSLSFKSELSVCPSQEDFRTCPSQGIFLTRCVTL